MFTDLRTNCKTNPLFYSYKGKWQYAVGLSGFASPVSKKLIFLIWQVADREKDAFISAQIIN